MCIESCSSAAKSQFKCGLCSVEYCSQQCAVTDWSQKHQFECVGVNEKRQRNVGKRTEPLILIGVDDVEVEVDMAFVEASSTLTLTLQDDPDKKSIKLQIHGGILRLLGVFAITGNYPRFRNLEQLSEFVNAANYLGMEGVDYSALLINFKEDIINSLLNSTNVILMHLLRRYLFPRLTIGEVKQMLNNENLNVNVRNIFMNQLIERAIVLFPRTFAKWGTQNLSSEQIAAIIEVLFIYNNAEGDKVITRAAAKETYGIPETAFKGLNQRIFYGRGNVSYFELNDILDIVISKHDSLANMRAIRQQKETKKATREEKKAKEAEEKRQIELSLYPQAKRMLVIKYGPKLDSYIDNLYDPDGYSVGTRTTLRDIVNYIMSMLIYNIQKSILSQLPGLSSELYEIFNNMIGFFLRIENLGNVLSDVPVFERFFKTLFRDIISRLTTVKNMFQRNGLQFDTLKFFNRYTSMIRDLPIEDFTSTIVFETDAMLTEAVRSRNYQKLSEILTPEKYVEVYEQVHGKESGFIFANLELTSQLWDLSFSL